MVLRPLGLRNTVAAQTVVMPQPVLQAYSGGGARSSGSALDLVPGGVDVLEPVVDTARGSVETTDIADMTRTAIGIGTERLLTRRSYRLQIDPTSASVIRSPAASLPDPQPRSGYGLGAVPNGGWILQNPLFGGYAALDSPPKRFSIALAVRFNASSFDVPGNHSNTGELGTPSSARSRPARSTGDLRSDTAGWFGRTRPHQSSTHNGPDLAAGHSRAMAATAD